MPAAAPSTMPIAVAATAMSSSRRPPYSTRERTSRPSASPPRRNGADGLAKVSVSRAFGECGANAGPTRATSTTRAAMARPAVPRGGGRGGLGEVRGGRGGGRRGADGGAGGGHRRGGARRARARGPPGRGGRRPQGGGQGGPPGGAGPGCAGRGGGGWGRRGY